MSFTIATNSAAVNTQKWLNVNSAAMNKSLERLSSGYKINSASDDAAGSAISLKLDVKASSVSKAIDNGNQAIGMLETAEGGMTTIADILNRLKTLATQAASDTVSDSDRTYINTEATQLEAELTNIISNTKYGDTAVLSTASKTFNFQLGDTNNSYDKVAYTADALSTIDVDLSSLTSAQAALASLDTAIASVNSAKATLGAVMNRVSFQVDNLNSIYENTESASSTIKDTDFAAEMSDYTSAQILVQSGISMLAQANQIPQQILSLMQ